MQSSNQQRDAAGDALACAGEPLRGTLPWPVAGLLLAAVSLFYFRLMLPGNILIQRDSFRLHYPIHAYVAERLSSGELPQWFPYDGLGRPLLGVAAAGVFHPFTALFLVLSPHAAYALACYLCALMAALGAAALSRRLGAGRAGSAVAGLVMALGGYCVSLSDNLLYLYSASAAPAFLLALDLGLGPRRKALVVAALLWASVFLIGDLQDGYYFGLVAGAWALWRGSGPRLARLGRLAVVALLAAALAAIQLAPSLAVFRDSARAQAGGFQAEATKWSMHPLRVVQFIVSPVADEPRAPEIADQIFHSGPWGYWSRSIYLGWLALGLAWLAWWRRRELRPLGWFSLAALWLAMGHHAGLYLALYRLLPLWSAFRYPEKLVAFGFVFLASLAGAGVDEMLKRPTRAWPWLVSAGVAAAAALSLWTAPAGAAAGALGISSGLWSALAEPTGRGLLVAGGLAAAVGVLAFVARSGRIRPVVLAGALVALVGGDLARANLDAYRLGPAEVAEFTPPFVRRLEELEGPLAPGRFRLVSFEQKASSVPRSLGQQLGLDAEAVAVKNALGPVHGASYRIEAPGAYLPAAPAALSSILMDQVNPQVLAHYNVRYMVDSERRIRNVGLESFVEAALPSFDLALARNPYPVNPRVYLAKRVEVPAPSPDWRALVARQDFRSGDVDFVEALEPLPSSAAGSGTAEVVSYEPERVVLQVKADAEAVLILADAFDRGWSATLDRQRPLSIMRANGLVRAVVIPAGAHSVEFSYRSLGLIPGLALSLASLAIAVGQLAAPRRRERDVGTAA